MRRARTDRWVFGVACGAALVLTAASAQALTSVYPLGPDPRDPDDPTIPHVMLNPVPNSSQDGYEWIIREPIDFYFTPTGGPIFKWLNAPTPFWQPGMKYSLHEEFRVKAPPAGANYRLHPVTDWHEKFATDSQHPNTAPGAFRWTGGDLKLWIDPDGPNGNQPMEMKTLDSLQVNVTKGGSCIEFEFFDDPVLPLTPPGEVIIHIWKDFEYVGPIGSTAPHPNQLAPIGVIEYPTPEPSTLGLIGLGAVALLRRRR